jgi:hypothetical protein
LLGAGVTVCWLNPFFGLPIAKRFPSKRIVPASLGIAFLATVIQIALLKALRESPTILHVVCLVVAAAMTILFFQLKPYLLYIFHGRALREIAEQSLEAETEKEAEQDAQQRLRRQRPRWKL